MYRNQKSCLTSSYFVYMFHMAPPTKELSYGMMQIFLCCSVFVFQNTNRCISSIVYQDPTTFSFVQRFVMTVIKKCMLFPQVVFNIVNITYTYVYSIIHCSHNTGCTPGYFFYSQYWSYVHNISYTCRIFYLRYM